MGARANSCLNNDVAGESLRLNPSPSAALGASADFARPRLKGAFAEPALRSAATNGLKDDRK